MKLGSGVARRALLVSAWVAGVAEATMAGALITSISGCADVWGFQDALDPLDSAVPSDGAPADDGAAGPADGPEGEEADPEAAVGEADGGADLEGGADGASCSGACVPLPDGWDGPFAFSESRTPSAPPLPDCGGHYSKLVFDGHASPSAPDATCACACAPPTGVVCTPPVVNFYSDASCTASCGLRNQAAPTACGAINTFGCFTPHYGLAPGTASGGSCTPSATSAPLAPVTWQANLRLCADPEGAAPGLCEAGSVCAAPRGPGGLCVRGPRGSTCPLEYPVSKAYSAGPPHDTRQCAPCTCGAVSGAACRAGVSADRTCATGVTLLAAPSCLPVGTLTYGVAKGASGGSCTPQGGKPIGSVTFDTATTFCCTAP